MGVDVEIVDYAGNTVKELPDRYSIFSRIVHYAPQKYCHLRQLKYVDVYDNAWFNFLQLPELIEDLDFLVAATTSDKEKEFLEAVIELAKEAMDSQRYLKMIGD
jgi:hypothetical protein